MILTNYEIASVHLTIFKILDEIQIFVDYHLRGQTKCTRMSDRLRARMPQRWLSKVSHLRKTYMRVPAIHCRTGKRGRSRSYKL